MKVKTHKYLYITRVVWSWQTSCPCCCCVTQCPLLAIDCSPGDSPRDKEGKTPSWQGHEAYCREHVTPLGPLLTLTYCLQYLSDIQLSPQRDQEGEEKHFSPFFFKHNEKTQTWSPVQDLFRSEIQQSKLLFVRVPPTVHSKGNVILKVIINRYEYLKIRISTWNAVRYK